jgi:exonuclease III
MILLLNTTFDELEHTNEQTNHTNDHVGDILEETPSSHTTRIYFQNLNGLRWDKDGGKWPYICDAMAGINVDIACFAETNTDTNNYNVRQKMEQIAQKQFHHSRLILSTTKTPTTTLYKPGGTAIMACNSITSTIKSHNRDRMGRWTSIRLDTHSGKHLRIISAYQVCPVIRTGSNSAASQQKAQLIVEDANQPFLKRRSPREAFTQDLQAFINQCQKNGDDILLVGDFNEDMDSEKSGIANIAFTCELADLFAIRLGNTTVPATYQRGTRRIDYALITPHLINSIQAAGYDPFGYRLPS